MVKKIIYTSILFYCLNSVTVNAQLLAPRKPTKVNVLLEVGGAAEMMAENSTHAFITGTST